MSNPYLYPYKARLMAALPNQEPIELARFRRRMLHADIEAWTNDLDPAWTVWAEYQTNPGDLVSKRWPLPHYKGNGIIALKITKEERADLAERGIQSVYAHL